MSNLVEWLEHWHKPFKHLRARVQIPSVVPPSSAQWIQSNWMQSNSTTTKEAIWLQVCWSIELLANSLSLFVINKHSLLPYPGLTWYSEKVQVGLGKDWITFLPGIWLYQNINKQKQFSQLFLYLIFRTFTNNKSFHLQLLYSFPTYQQNPNG